jgi:hypothetical protein
MMFDEKKVVEYLTCLVREKHESEAYKQQVREGTAMDMSNIDPRVNIDCVNPCIIMQVPLTAIGNTIGVATVYLDGETIRASLHPPFNYVDALPPRNKKVA